MNFHTGGRIYKPIFSCSMHTHENWEIILQYTEHTVASAGEHRFEMNAGDVIVIPPGTRHNTSSDVRFCDMHIQLKKCDFPTFPFVITDKDGNITRLFEMTMEAFVEKAEGYELFVEKLSELICLYLRKNFKEQGAPESISRFKLLLMENLENEDFRLGEQLEQTGYHPDYFRRIFREHTGYSPMEYLNRIRMDRAGELLRFEKYMRIGEVARRCGFGDSLYFSKRFKKETGMSPVEYRDARRNGGSEASLQVRDTETVFGEM